MIYRKNKDLVMTKICDETMLVAIGELYKKIKIPLMVNNTATFYLNLLDNDMSIDEMAKNASEKYSVPIEKIMPGLEKWLDEFTKLGYIDIVG